MWFIDKQAIDGLELRAWMGNVAETIVAKHAARMGLVRYLTLRTRTPSRQADISPLARAELST